MVVTNWAKERIGLFIGGSTTDSPAYFAIGSGSGAAYITATGLIHTVDGQAFTSTTNTSQKVKWIGDWNSVEMSGIKLRQFGVKVEAGLAGSIWSITSLPALTFDGTNELRIEETWEVY